MIKSDKKLTFIITYPNYPGNINILARAITTNIVDLKRKTFIPFDNSGSFMINNT
jgi:hypothetical protein